MQNYKTILLVSYGRTGSTLLQGLLNSIDGYLVRGENHNLFHGFYIAHEALRKTLELCQATGIEPAQSWYGAAYYDENMFIANLRRTATELLQSGEQARCLGFKEIRYYNRYNEEELVAYLDFLQVLFEDACIIFNTRSLSDTVNSSWWRERDPEVLTRSLQKFEDILSAYGKGRDNFFRFDYEDMVGRTAKIEALFEFLGEDYDMDQVDAVLSARHGIATAELPPQVVGETMKSPGVFERLRTKYWIRPWSEERVLIEKNREKEIDDQLNLVYREVLERRGDPEGLATYGKLLKKGISIEEIESMLRDSEEFASLQKEKAEVDQRL